MYPNSLSTNAKYAGFYREGIFILLDFKRQKPWLLLCCKIVVFSFLSFFFLKMLLALKISSVAVLLLSLAIIPLLKGEKNSFTNHFYIKIIHKKQVL